MIYICVIVLTQTYKKMKGKSKLIQLERDDTIYERVAKEFDVTARYVGKIARSERKAERGKGLLIKQRLIELSGNKKK